VVQLGWLGLPQPTKSQSKLRADEWQGKGFFNNEGVAGNIGKKMCLLTSLKLTASL